MNRNLVIAIVTLVILLVFGIIYFGNRELEDDSSGFKRVANDITKLPSPSASISATISPAAEATITATGSALGMENTNELIVEDLKTGTGGEAKAGDTVTVNYKGILTNGTQFDSSYDRGQPFSFNLGAGSVIEGWDKGVAGMKVGGKRKLVIPPDMAYGARTLPGIPANSTLVFEVELLKVE